MKSFVVALVALPALAAAQAIINTPPAIVQCQPVAIQFSEGTAPYFISVLPGGQQSAAPLKSFPTQGQAGSYTWTVDLPAGTAITLQIRDGSGQLNYSDQRTIQPGTDNACLNGDAGGAASSAASSASSFASSVSSSLSSSAAAASGTTTTTVPGVVVGSSTSAISISMTTTAASDAAESTSTTVAPMTTVGTGAAKGRIEAGLGLGLAALLAVVIVA